MNDLHSLAVAEAMFRSGTSFSSPHQEYYHDFSTGYLEDALIEFTSKRRRLLQPCSDEQRKNNSIDDFEKSFWNFNFNPIWQHQPVENFYCMNHIENISGLSDEHINTSSRSFTNEEPNNIMVAETIPPEDTTISESESPNSSSSSYKESVTSKTIQVNLLTRDPKVTPPGTSGYDEKRKKVITRKTRVVYPFAMVKSGGIEGDVTLNDINERTLMPPTRPVKHPVGDFACHPFVSVGQGSGLSGKPVVSLTTIHTLGRRGTITIIRTKG
ncbi:hypothetical protein Lal_00008129 [Lupinus albus]|uniref:Uncharacterized protein n=1 Tax=Lupinus albus TaxID=3870 RepID=A0A6A4PPC0_LUPAL|nr:hypothetical protein Lalb_Chr12g0209261 [Lupinus albus]KAF1868323.1 hypothetical protein Lal_00008129 [Lupinus albus]